MPPEALLTIGFIILSFVVSIFVARAINSRAAGDPEVVKEGAPGKATVKSIAQTGTWINNNPQVQFVLEVRQEGWDPYEATTRRVVEVIDVPRIQPGAELDVRIDPDDRSSVVIVGL